MRRMFCRACRTASDVTAQVLTTTALSNAGGGRLAPDHFGLGDVEPAAEGDDVDAHGAAACVSNNAGSNVPLNSNATGPVIST